MVAEDSLDMRRIICKTLRDAGFTDVHTAEDGDQAIEMLEETEGIAVIGGFKLILLDLNMPNVNGMEVLEYIKGKEELKSIYVVVISAVKERETIARAIQLGADDYMVKPFKPQMLKDKLQQFLEKL